MQKEKMPLEPDKKAAHSQEEALELISALKGGDGISVLNEEGENWKYSGHVVDSKDGTKLAQVILKEPDGSAKEIWVDIRRLSSREAQGRKRTIADAEKKSGIVLEVPNEKRMFLDGKLAEYESRLTLKGKSPAYILDAKLKIEILDRLLDKGKIDSEEVWSDIQRAHGDEARRAFDSAFGVITAYVRGQEDLLEKK